MHEESYGLAYIVSNWAAGLQPSNAAPWQNMGKICHEKQRDEQADECFRRAIKIRPNFPNALEGLSMSSLHRGEFKECIDFANRAIAEDPALVEARVNRGMAYLALKRWREGWRDYDANNGSEKNRKVMKYGEEPRWDGTKGLDVVCYMEQGIGDEISFGDCLPDLIRDCKSVTIECDKKLAPLFRRSFPQCEVYGTRYKPDDARGWVHGKKFDARVAVGELPRFYRNKDSEFPGKSYLIPNPLMAEQWKATLKSLGDKPKIGLAWTGGLPHTGTYRRSVTLDTFAPLFQGLDATWVSLQYKDYEGIPKAEEKYGVKIHDWEWGTRYWDYDQTVALISQLDVVVSVCTTVVHASAGLGKDCYCLVPEKGQLWRYLAEGEWFPWGAGVKLKRQKNKQWPIVPILIELKEKFPAYARNGHSQSKIAA